MAGKKIIPLRTALVFALFGGLWIIVSDVVLGYFIPASSPYYVTFQTIKGWLFVLASASLIYLILARDLKSLKQKQQHIAYQAGLINDVSDALISTDMQLKVVTWNTAAEKIYGWKADEVIGHDLNDFLKTEYPQGENYEIALQKLAEQGHFLAERIQSRKDGTRFPVLSSVSFVRDEKGRSIGFVAVNRDITENKQARELLLQSEERFQKAFRSGPVGLSITRGADGVYLDANDAFCRTVGFSHQELIGQTSLGLKIITPEQRERYVHQIKEHSLIHTEEMTLRSKSGDFRTVLGSMEVIEIDHEPCVLSTAIDITERKQMENALRSNEMRFRSLIENGLDNISLLDAEGKLLWESPSTIRMLGYERDAFVGRNILDLVHPEDIEWVQAQFMKMLGQPRVPYRGTFRIRHLDGSWRWVESIGTNLLDEPSVNAIVINYRDITEKKTTEEALGKTEQKWLSLVKTIPDYIALFDKDDRYLFLNHYAEGYSEKDVIGRLNADFLPNESRDGYMQSFEKARLTGQTRFVEYQGYGDLGSIRYYDSYFTPIFENGEFANMLVFARDITERKQAEELRKQSDQRYRLLFENMPIAIWEEDFSEVKEYLNSLKQQGVTDFRSYFEMHPDAVVECAHKIRILDVNAAAVTMYEADNKQELIKDTNEGVSKAEIKNIREVLVALAQGITSGGWEDVEETLKGKPIEISLSWSVVTGYDHDYSRVIVTTIDITERKLAEEAIRESNEVLRAILNASTESVFVMDSNGIVLAGNEMTASRFGKKIADMIGANIYDFLPTDVAEARKKRADNVFRERKPVHFEDERFGVWIENSLYPIFESDGQVKRIAVYGRDITERKRAESRDRKRTYAFELLAKGASLSTVLEAIIAIIENDFEDALCSILLLDESKQHLLHGAALRLPEFFNQAIHGQEIGMGNGSCGTAAYTGQRVIVEDIETHPYWENYRDLAQRAGLRASWSQPILSSSGEVLGTFAIYHVQPSTPRAEELESVLNVANLASVAIERKHAEKTIREYAATLEQRVEQRTAELIRANRTKDEFLANMSHELRTPLNSVLGFSEMLLEGVRGPLNERQSQALQMIRASGEHLLGLINDILDVSKIESGKFEIRLEPVAVNDICHSSLNFIKQLSIKKSILVEYSSSPIASTILVDPKRLKQILVNLLSNAVKFTPEKGKVSLGVLADPERGQMRFSVTDTGIGIAPDDLKKLFKPFIQVDGSLSRQYEGTGLGLILVKRLVEMHGGTVEVESTIGVGSVFTVILPWDQDVNRADNKFLFTNDEQIKSAISASTLLSHSEVKILLVEDNDANVMVVGDYLRNHGYQVYVARHGGEALVMAAELAPHLVLMDIQMPEMDGLEAIRRLRTEPATATVPIVALTAFAMPGDRERCLEAGANDYLSKPFKLSVLQQTIEAILNHPA